MSKNQKTVFDKLTEALEKAAEELDTTNSYLYGIGAELADLNSTMKSILERLDTILDKPISVTITAESLASTLEKTSATSTREIAKPTELTFPDRTKKKE